MANDEHVALLKQGVDAWNAWRRYNPDIRPDLSEANLSGADLRRAHLYGANLTRADLSEADLSGADLRRADLSEAHEPTVTVDNIEVAQFIYLMLNNQKVRDVIDTITSKAVLVLGRFTVERKAVLDALRQELRKRN